MIELVSNLYEVLSIKKDTKAKFYEDLNVGDVIRIHTYLENRGQSSSGSRYASYPTIHNLTKKTSNSSKSEPEISNIISRCFELGKIE